MPKDERKYWSGSKPTNCQWCGVKITLVFVDGSTRRGWAILCESCHETHGFGLGTGKGQRYFLSPESGKWVKDNPDDRPETGELRDLQTRLFTT